MRGDQKQLLSLVASARGDLERLMQAEEDSARPEQAEMASGG